MSTATVRSSWIAATYRCQSCGHEKRWFGKGEPVCSLCLIERGKPVKMVTTEKAR